MWDAHEPRKGARSCAPRRAACMPDGCRSGAGSRSFSDRARARQRPRSALSPVVRATSSRAPVSRASSIARSPQAERLLWTRRFSSPSLAGVKPSAPPSRPPAASASVRPAPSDTTRLADALVCSALHGGSLFSGLATGWSRADPFSGPLGSRRYSAKFNCRWDNPRGCIVAYTAFAARPALSHAIV
jgi:hypothetical protein